MAFATGFSRFDLLNDDAPDPFEKKKKPAKTNTNKKTSGSSKSTDQSQGNSANKKNKKKPSSTNAENNKNNNAPQPTPQEEYPELGTDMPLPSAASLPTAARSKKKDHWSEWAKRDEEFVAETFETELEKAIFQSKLEFLEEQTRIEKKVSKKAKKKAAPVSLPEFNSTLSAGSGQFAPYIPPENGSNGFDSGYSDENGGAIVAQMRHEAKLEVEKQRQLELERKLIKSRSPVPVEKFKPDVNFDHIHNPMTQLMYNNVIEEKDKIIAQLLHEKSTWQAEMDTLKARFKKICSVLGDAQLKDKAAILVDLEKMTKLNQDLNENVKELHEQLEQEKSRSHSAQVEIRKLNEQSRRRNQQSESNAS